MFSSHRIGHQTVDEEMEDGDRRDACPTGLAFISGTR